jgi:hypothetical protein
VIHVNQNTIRGVITDRDIKYDNSPMILSNPILISLLTRCPQLRHITIIPPNHRVYESRYVADRTNANSLMQGMRNFLLDMHQWNNQILPSLLSSSPTQHDHVTSTTSSLEHIEGVFEATDDDETYLSSIRMSHNQQPSHS